MIVNFVAMQQARKWRKPERDFEVSGKSDACGITLLFRPAPECVSNMKEVQFRADWAAFQGGFPPAAA
jgi:hypothetical protein